MSRLPDHQPARLSLGPLEKEILEVLWLLQEATAREIHEYVLKDPDRELSYSSVTTILGRLAQKGWVGCDEAGRAFRWRALVSCEGARALEAHNRLQSFLSVGTPEVMAALADCLDEASLEQLQAITARIQQARAERCAEEPPCT
ncbi:BlaI/MecI/CopY family transcriptional regulator [Anthocerotibacter panamensis]|uniref:BlaI/MecI/CopY family transcriptional regulator n=1 Tax=Anthocerotibacter panamensis TaxID=2857077 RepID=UPI001C404140|nr:BlaI/MecI/CopY family transcriptional regulator [Anthocerotibacter panamensis]